MFVQITKSARQNGKTYLSYLVRESFRTPRGPRSRTVCNITDLPPATRDLIAASLHGQDFLAAEQCQLDQALDYGGLAVLNDAWSRFGLGELLGAIGSERQRGLLQAVIFSRLLFPCPKLSLAQKAQGTWRLKPAGWTRRSPSMRTIFITPWTSSTANGWPWKNNSTSGPSPNRLVWCSTI